MSYSISSGVLESPDLLLLSSIITLRLHSTIILIITHQSNFNHALNRYTALEITDTRGFSLLFSCQSVHATSQMLVGLLEAELPSSIFRSVLGAKNLQMLRGYVMRMRMRIDIT